MPEIAFPPSTVTPSSENRKFLSRLGGSLAGRFLVADPPSVALNDGSDQGPVKTNAGKSPTAKRQPAAQRLGPLPRHALAQRPASSADTPALHSTYIRIFRACFVYACGKACQRTELSLADQTVSTQKRSRRDRLRTQPPSRIARTSFPVSSMRPMPDHPPATGVHDAQPGFARSWPWPQAGGKAVTALAAALSAAHHGLWEQSGERAIAASWATRP